MCWDLCTYVSYMGVASKCKFRDFRSPMAKKPEIKSELLRQSHFTIFTHEKLSVSELILVLSS